LAPGRQFAAEQAAGGSGQWPPVGVGRQPLAVGQHDLQRQQQDQRGDRGHAKGTLATRRGPCRCVAGAGCEDRAGLHGRRGGRLPVIGRVGRVLPASGGLDRRVGGGSRRIGLGLRFGGGGGGGVGGGPG